MSVNQVDYNAALATIEYLRDTVAQYKDQLQKRETYTTVKVTGNYWVYGSDKACTTLQQILFEHQMLKEKHGSGTETPNSNV